MRVRPENLQVYRHVVAFILSSPVALETGGKQTPVARKTQSLVALRQARRCLYRYRDFCIGAPPERGWGMPMCWGKEIGILRQLTRVAVVLAVGLSTAACFQPLYGSQSLSSGGGSLGDKLATVDVAQIPAGNGTPEARLAVALRNELMFDFNNGAAPSAPIYRLQVTLPPTSITTVIVDVASGRPSTQVESVNASFTLTEIATNKIVLNASTFARASFDTPGSAEQRFAQQRAWRNAEDRAITQVGENIRNRLASFFVAGT
jgi:LPS-assembly lipoprotein